MSDTDKDFDLDEYERKYSGGEITGPLLAEIKRLKALVYGYDKEVKILRELPAETKWLRARLYLAEDYIVTNAPLHDAYSSHLEKAGLDGVIE